MTKNDARTKQQKKQRGRAEAHDEAERVRGPTSGDDDEPIVPRHDKSKRTKGDA